MNNPEKSSSTVRVALVTGATGFVGSHIVSRLVHDGWRVHVLSRVSSRMPNFAEFTNIQNHVHDGTTESMLRCIAEAKPEIVFHLASLFVTDHQSTDVDSLVHSNILFGSQLLEAMKNNGVRFFINTGTAWQYYNNEYYNPVCLYAATKQAFEALLEYYVQVHQINAITLTLFDTYGPEDSRNKLFNLLHKAVLTGDTLHMSAGEQLIDLVHVWDVVDAYLVAAKRLFEEKVFGHEKYVVSSGGLMSLKNIVHIYQSAIKKNVPVVWGARPYRPREVMVPWRRGVPLVDWKPNIALHDGLMTIVNN